jgi:hypothetical protein
MTVTVAAAEVARRNKATLTLLLVFMLGGATYAFFGDESKSAQTNTAQVPQQPQDKSVAKIEVDEDGRVKGSFDLWKIAEGIWKNLTGT